jgi:hypothetical protein
MSFTYAFLIIVAVMPVPRGTCKRPAAALAITGAGRPNAAKRQKGGESQPITIDTSQLSHPIVIDEDAQRESLPTSPR